MADKATNITELPLDILLLIFPYLDAKSFLAFCSTCKAFQQPLIRLDAAYWSQATRSTFRVPNQPVVQHDGLLWQSLYRRMLTQTRVYTWGCNTHHRLGHTYEQAPAIRNPTMPRLGRFFHSSNCSFPTEMEDTRNLGVIADLQCGGWSTTLLTSKGHLYTAGVLDGQVILHTAPDQGRLQALRFPAGYPSSTTAPAYYEPATAIRQFSAGRSHILGLSDTGRIWSWYDNQRPSLHVKFLNINVADASVEDSMFTARSQFGTVKQVVAGWSCSSAYVCGTGIVLWRPVSRTREEEMEEIDGVLVVEAFEVPKTSYQRSKGGVRDSDEEKALGEEVGMLLNYIILEQFVLFNTDLGKIFCGRLKGNNKVTNIIELRTLRSNSGGPSDVQGSFRRFAVFKDGEVIIGNQDYLDACWNARTTDLEQTDIPGLKKIPALQHNDVISVAFGDYHFLALHSTGKITAYGTELQSCGALGLAGDARNPIGRLRGISHNQFAGRGNGKLLPHAYTHGRQVWFEPERKKWLEFLINGGMDPEEARERCGLFSSDTNVQGEVSEWIEQEGSEWLSDKGEDGLGAYFALRVSAAGWHSGALVLVNEELAGRKADYEWRDKTFPRLKLSDGREMPGTKEFDEWRYGRPEWSSESFDEF